MADTTKTYLSYERLKEYDELLKTDVDSKLSGKSDANHNHDDVYETKSDAKLKYDELVASQVQSDWNQNDETAPDYVKNRTHYEGSTIVTRYFNIGSSDYSVKLYDAAFTQLLYDNYQTATYMFGNEVGYCSPMNKNDNYATFYAVIGSDRVSFMADIYHGYVEFNNRQLSTGRDTLTISIETKVLHQLDEKFIPNTIARLDDIPQPDWNQTDETAPDYVKNRTHGIRKEVLIDDPNANLVSKDTDVRECTYTFASSITLVPVADYTLVVNGVSAKGVCSQLQSGRQVPFTVNGGEWIIYEDRAEIKLPYKESNYHVTLIGSNDEIYQLDEKFIPDTITRTEYVDAKLDEVNTSIDNITSGEIVVKEAEHAESADEATHAVSADSATIAETSTKATQDASGNVITETYETKEDAKAKYDEVKGLIIPSDWEQNDETSVDYIKNRTHYDATYEEIVTLSYDGNREGKEIYKVGGWDNGYLVKLSDMPLTKEEMIGTKFQRAFSYTNILDPETISEYSVTDYGTCVMVGNADIVSVLAESDDNPYPLSKGIWVLDIGSSMCIVSYTATFKLGELKQLDEKFIPDSIARVSKLPQSDWNQNDENAHDYIKNKPVVEAEVYVDTLTWDGKTKDILCVYDMYYKISDAVPTLEYFANGIIKVYDDGDEYVVSREVLEEQYNSFGFINDSFLIIPSDNFTSPIFDDPNLVFPEAGIYFISEIRSIIIPGYNGFKTTIQQIDEKFIPDTIARTEDVVKLHKQPDWNQNDETASDYIKNKPFGEKAGNVVLIDATPWFYEGISTSNAYEPFPIEIGRSYKMIIDDIEYDGIGTADEYGSFISFTSDEVENRVIRVAYDIDFSDSSAEGYHHVLLWTEGTVVVPIEEKYIPDTIARVFDVEPFIINVTKNEDGSYTSDKTHDEVTKAYKKGKLIAINDGINRFYLDMCIGSYFHFSYTEINEGNCLNKGFVFGTHDEVTAFDRSFDILDFIENNNWGDSLTTTNKTIIGAINQLDSGINGIMNGFITAKNAENASHAVTADTATSATKATQDASGKVITDTYETKTDADAKLKEAKSYADTAANTVKNDLLNGAGDAYDTLQELGDLIDGNKGAIDALRDIAIGKADADHGHNDATASASGFMTPEMVEKLNNIEDGATKVVVDSALSETSTNPVQNKVINDAIKLVAGALDAHTTAVDAHSGRISALEDKVNGLEPISSDDIKALFSKDN